jgi:hypothetical protein
VLPLTDVIPRRPESINHRYLCHGNYQKRARSSPSKHRVSPNGIITTGAESTYRQTIEKAFGQKRLQIPFNIDVFTGLVL